MLRRNGVGLVTVESVRREEKEVQGSLDGKLGTLVHLESSHQNKVVEARCSCRCPTNGDKALLVQMKQLR